jgi:hypothetical protein
MAVEAAHGEGQRSRGLRVEPLEVVDRHHDGPRLGGRREQRADADADGRRVRRPARAARPPHERHLQRLALGSWERGEVLIGERVREVAEADERQPRLGLLGDAAQHAAAGRLRRGERRPPERGLADPGLALEQQRARAVAEAVDEGTREGEFLIAADDGIHVSPRRGVLPF